MDHWSNLKATDGSKGLTPETRPAELALDTACTGSEDRQL